MRKVFNILAVILLSLYCGVQVMARNMGMPVKVVVVHDTIYIDSSEQNPKARSINDIINSLPEVSPSEVQIAYFSAPRVFRGYQHIHTPSFAQNPYAWKEQLTPYEPSTENFDLTNTLFEISNIDSISQCDFLPQEQIKRQNPFAEPEMPEWLAKGIRLNQIRDDVSYLAMVQNPNLIERAFWRLPEPPRMPKVDRTFAGYIRSQWIPKPSKTIFGGLMETEKINWIHDADAGLQLSQAYISPNWYQGGSSSLSFLLNLYWHVQLNTIFHPDVLFDNTLSYKLGITSSPQDQYHKYIISEDLFQWNLKAGVKAFDHWFYSVTAQFKTQIFNTYGANSQTRSASFLSPGDFNAGLGMTYAFVNKNKKLKFNASISPISYNLKTCIDTAIDPVQFNIEAGKKLRNEIGSNAELTLDWSPIKSINYRSRFFVFTNYNYFQGDWENTLSFNFNRFISTQIYCHLRYDSSSDLSSGKWHHWMLKEILSFGFSYTFSTKS
ncbi:MAG: DUF3078 domain-containing protein [Prevotella sp.]|nr:DUF3078 domain-containing protein [Bacteroides sp.]MCM1366612.1 DUF3078 domain-containing protein [Prevotella sp.]MCM1437291.1 DUF3078 domain-containing protein [Prevotella sp.]